MKFRKGIALLLSAALTLTMLTACGGNGTEGTGSSASEVSAAAPAKTAAPDTAPETTPVEEEASVSASESVMEAEDAPQLEEVSLPLFEETRTYTMWTMLPFFMNGLVSDVATDINIMKLLQE